MHYPSDLGPDYVPTSGKSIAVKRFAFNGLRHLPRTHDRVPSVPRLSVSPFASIEGTLEPVITYDRPRLVRRHPDDVAVRFARPVRFFGVLIGQQPFAVDPYGDDPSMSNLLGYSNFG
jgi:hypothetical protein